MLNFYRVAQSFGRFEPSHANCGRGLFVMLMPLISVSVTFLVVLSVLNFQFRIAAVNVVKAGSDVRLRGAQMEEVCNSRVKEINFSMRALLSVFRSESRRRRQIPDLIGILLYCIVLHDMVLCSIAWS